MFKKLASSLLLAVLAIASAGSALGQGADNYPNKPIRFIVPFTPGGPNDILARLVGQKLSERWSQQVAVDNRGGANGIIGADAAAKSPPDGYTLFLGNAGVLTTNPALYPKLPYDAERDFAPVNLMATAPFLLVVQPTLGAKNLPELIQLAKSRDGQLNRAASGRPRTWPANCSISWPASRPSISPTRARHRLWPICWAAASPSLSPARWRRCRT